MLLVVYIIYLTNLTNRTYHFICKLKCEFQTSVRIRSGVFHLKHLKEGVWYKIEDYLWFLLIRNISANKCYSNIISNHSLSFNFVYFFLVLRCCFWIVFRYYRCSLSTIWHDSPICIDYVSVNNFGAYICYIKPKIGQQTKRRLRMQWNFFHPFSLVLDRFNSHHE